MVRLAEGARTSAPMVREKPARYGTDRMPMAVCSGPLELGGVSVECHVLNTGERVIHLRSAVQALTGREHGNLGEIVGVAALKSHLDADLVLGENRAFLIPGTQFIGHGLTAETFNRICRAFVSALAAGALRTQRQQMVAIRCSLMLGASADVGLIALIDEATGFEKVRAARELQAKHSFFFADRMRPWEKTFPDELWVQFARLTGWTGPIQKRPRWWGKLVTELIYEALDSDVLLHLKTHKPPPRHRQNWHQWFNEDQGLRALLAHIDQVLGIAKSCDCIEELSDRVAIAFSTRHVQIPLPLYRR
ncbi:MAG TPA: P63C domain-containing protein [Longimicrobiaceae bacterium]|nr:P63C domain-containing protein [Longimicrobiaceae bacterium]